MLQGEFALCPPPAKLAVPTGSVAEDGCAAAALLGIVRGMTSIRKSYVSHSPTAAVNTSCRWSVLLRLRSVCRQDRRVKSLTKSSHALLSRMGASPAIMKR